MSTTWLAQAAIRVLRCVIAAGAAGSVSAGPIWGSKASELRESCLSDGSAATANQGTTLDVPLGSPAITPALHHIF